MTNADTVSLPSDAAEALASAYEAYATTISERQDADARAQKATILADLASLGRDAGWPYRQLAEPCGVTPERLRQIIRAYATGNDVEGAPEFPPCPAVQKSQPQTRAENTHLTKDEARALRDLAKSASRNTGSRPKDSPFRKNSEEFSRLIMLHHDRGVIWEEISDATRAWKTWPLDGELGAFCAQMKELRKAQQRARQERNSLRARIRDAVADARHAKRSVRSDKHLKALQAELEEVLQRLEVLRGQIADLDEKDPARPHQTASGIRMRAARHGYGKGAPPSIAGYKGIVVSPPPGGKRKTPA